LLTHILKKEQNIFDLYLFTYFSKLSFKNTIYFERTMNLGVTVFVFFLVTVHVFFFRYNYTCTPFCSYVGDFNLECKAYDRHLTCGIRSRKKDIFATFFYKKTGIKLKPLYILKEKRILICIYSKVLKLHV